MTDNLTPDEIGSLLERHKISVIVAQTGYLSEQPSMRNFEKLLQSGKQFERVKTIPIEGKTNRNEQELVIYKKRD